MREWVRKHGLVPIVHRFCLPAEALHLAAKFEVIPDLPVREDAEAVDYVQRAARREG